MSLVVLGNKKRFALTSSIFTSVKVNGDTGEHKVRVGRNGMMEISLHHFTGSIVLQPFFNRNTGGNGFNDTEMPQSVRNDMMMDEDASDDSDDSLEDSHQLQIGRRGEKRSAESISQGQEDKEVSSEASRTPNRSVLLSTTVSQEDDEEHNQPSNAPPLVDNPPAEVEGDNNVVRQLDESLGDEDPTAAPEDDGDPIPACLEDPGTTKKFLKDLCRDYKIKGHANMNKPELVKHIKSNWHCRGVHTLKYICVSDNLLVLSIVLAPSRMHHG